MELNLSERPKIIARPDVWFAFIKVLGNEHAPEAWRTLTDVIWKDKMVEKDSEFIAAFYPDPITQKMHYEAGITVSHEFTSRDALKCRRLEGGKYASFMLKGPYENIYSAFSKLNSNWVTENRHQLRDAACLEVYLNDPKTTLSKDLLTELLIPIK
ncbi:DNA gyrase inhibitor [compost metagenome]